MTKEEIRATVVPLRKEIERENRAILDRRIFQRAHMVPAFQLAHRVHIYRSTSEEVDTWSFIEYAWGIGKEVYVPRVSDSDSFESVLINRDTHWAVSDFGIPQPVGDDLPILDASDLTGSDIVVVPLLAFDRACSRVGYGKGMYDMFLADCGAATIGIAYELQRVLNIDSDEHDVALQMIATEERWYLKP